MICNIIHYNDIIWNKIIVFISITVQRNFWTAEIYEYDIKNWKMDYKLKKNSIGKVATVVIKVKIMSLSRRKRVRKSQPLLIKELIMFKSVIYIFKYRTYSGKMCDNIFHLMISSWHGTRYMEEAFCHVYDFRHFWIYDVFFWPSQDHIFFISVSPKPVRKEYCEWTFHKRSKLLQHEA